jgi:hypothetical protein
LFLDTIKEFKPAQLSNPPRAHGTGVTSQSPQESQYGLEFYRALHISLSGNIMLSPEFGTPGRMNGGMIDFYIPVYKFGFELIANGSNIRNLYQRFLSGGQYFDWIASEHILSWLVIDFRTNKPREPHPGRFIIFPSFHDTLFEIP